MQDACNQLENNAGTGRSQPDSHESSSREASLVWTASILQATRLQAAKTIKAKVEAAGQEGKVSPGTFFSGEPPG